MVNNDKKTRVPTKAAPARKPAAASRRQGTRGNPTTSPLQSGDPEKIIRKARKPKAKPAARGPSPPPPTPQSPSRIRTPSAHQGTGHNEKLSPYLTSPRVTPATVRVAASTPSGPSTVQGAEAQIESSSSRPTPAQAITAPKNAASASHTPSASSTVQGSGDRFYTPKSYNGKRRAASFDRSNPGHEDVQRPAKRVRGETQAEAQGGAHTEEEALQPTPKPVIHDLKKREVKVAKRSIGSLLSQIPRNRDSFRYHTVQDYDESLLSDDDLQDAPKPKQPLSRKERYALGQEVKQTAVYFTEVHNFLEGKPTTLVHQRDVERKVQERVQEEVEQAIREHSRVAAQQSMTLSPSLLGRIQVRDSSGRDQAFTVTNENQRAYLFTFLTHLSENQLPPRHKFEAFLKQNVESKKQALASDDGHSLASPAPATLRFRSATVGSAPASPDQAPQQPFAPSVGFSSTFAVPDSSDSDSSMSENGRALTPVSGNVSAQGDGDARMSEHGHDEMPISESEEEREVTHLTTPSGVLPDVATPKLTQDSRQAGWTSSAKSLLATPFKIFGKLAELATPIVTDAPTAEFNFDKSHIMPPLPSTSAPRGSRKAQGKANGKKRNFQTNRSNRDKRMMTRGLPIPPVLVDPKLDFSGLLSEEQLIKIQDEHHRVWLEQRAQEALDKELYDQSYPHKPTRTFTVPGSPETEEERQKEADEDFENSVMEDLARAAIAGEVTVESNCNQSPKFLKALDFVSFSTQLFSNCDAPSTPMGKSQNFREKKNNPFGYTFSPYYSQTLRDVEMVDAPLSMRDPSFRIPEMDDRATLHYRSPELALTGLADAERVREKWKEIEWDEDVAFDLFSVLYKRALMFVSQNDARNGGALLSEKKYLLKLTNRWFLLEAGRPDKFWMGRKFDYCEDRSLERKYLLMKLQTITDLDDADITAAKNAGLEPSGTFAQNPYSERLNTPGLDHLHETCPAPSVLRTVCSGFAEIPKKLKMIADHTTELENSPHNDIVKRSKLDLKEMCGPGWAQKRKAEDDAHKKQVDYWMASFEGKCEHCQKALRALRKSDADDGLSEPASEPSKVVEALSPTKKSTLNKPPKLSPTKLAPISEKYMALLKKDMEFEVKVDVGAFNLRLGKIVL
ncbi:hypothetical protein MBM_07751 [Drepanopeziza brunnea f. sp. 'multigermtubi' MB_m1]|uniref:Uncharacterized protein n=1 Tax=Marssonina brunnea f. sp. multigermtubi (strain MB_m1) TaxID=1072389 RepID=K1XNL2_MARBU|nr:uncharacterized protein MBM_07751 [Drepanopeziza brunnea f. sp. 'multigermtubi' MB_m1]EKD14074.1 hypothetical protein MBM_07751 [Drepanopeziza brunnea f. sp. 'multigermtubi' MB_m1]